MAIKGEGLAPKIIVTGRIFAVALILDSSVDVIKDCSRIIRKYNSSAEDGTIPGD